jgi:hypothetical protein
VKLNTCAGVTVSTLLAYPPPPPPPAFSPIIGLLAPAPPPPPQSFMVTDVTPAGTVNELTPAVLNSAASAALTGVPPTTPLDTIPLNTTPINYSSSRSLLLTSVIMYHRISNQ